MSLKTWAAALCFFAFTSTVPARAACLLEPITCTAAGIGIIAGIIKGIAADNVVHPISVEQDLEVVTQIVRDLRSIDNYTIEMVRYGSYNPGYRTIIRRYEAGKIKGRLSLEGMRDFSTGIFDDLDTLQEVIGKNVGVEKVEAAYGPKLLADGSINWERYYLLATDADALYKSLWAVKK